MDCHLLKEVYINLLDQKAPKLDLESNEIVDIKYNEKYVKNKKNIRKIIKPSNEELMLHKKYLKSDLPKNYF